MSVRNTEEEWERERKLSSEYLKSFKNEQNKKKPSSAFAISQQRDPRAWELNSKSRWRLQLTSVTVGERIWQGYGRGTRRWEQVGYPGPRIRWTLCGAPPGTWDGISNCPVAGG